MGEEPILVSSSLWFWLSLLKEGKKRRKQVGSVKKFRLGNYPNSLLVYVGVRKSLTLILKVFGWFKSVLWFVLVVTSNEEQFV